MMLIVARTMEMLGTVLLGITVLLVHRRVASDKKIDRTVIGIMAHEQAVGWIAIMLIVLGFILEMITYATY